MCLNLFAGKVLMECAEVRVVVDPDAPAHFHMDALDFVVMAMGEGWMFDTVILDPPYNVRKAREKYEGRYIGRFTEVKEVLPSVIAPGGRMITLGYDTVGMSKSRGFEKIAVCVVCHGGDHNDTLGLVEKKVKG